MDSSFISAAETAAAAAAAALFISESCCDDIEIEDEDDLIRLEKCFEPFDIDLTNRSVPQQQQQHNYSQQHSNDDNNQSTTVTNNVMVQQILEDFSVNIFDHSEFNTDFLMPDDLLEDDDINISNCSINNNSSSSMIDFGSVDSSDIFDMMVLSQDDDRHNLASSSLQLPPYESRPHEPFEYYHESNPEQKEVLRCRNTRRSRQTRRRTEQKKKRTNNDNISSSISSKSSNSIRTNKEKYDIILYSSASTKNNNDSIKVDTYNFKKEAASLLSKFKCLKNQNTSNTSKKTDDSITKPVTRRKRKLSSNDDNHAINKKTKRRRRSSKISNNSDDLDVATLSVQNQQQQQQDQQLQQQNNVTDSAAVVLSSRRNDTQQTKETDVTTSSEHFIDNGGDSTTSLQFKNTMKRLFCHECVKEESIIKNIESDNDYKKVYVLFDRILFDKCYDSKMVYPSSISCDNPLHVMKLYNTKIIMNQYHHQADGSIKDDNNDNVIDLDNLKQSDFFKIYYELNNASFFKEMNDHKLKQQKQQQFSPPSVFTNDGDGYVKLENLTSQCNGEDSSPKKKRFFHDNDHNGSSSSSSNRSNYEDDFVVINAFIILQYLNNIQ